MVGILILNPDSPMAQTIDDLGLIWGASFPDEYADRVTHLPVGR